MQRLELIFCKKKKKIGEWKKIRIIIQFLRFLFLFVGCENEMHGINCKYHCSGHCLNNGTCNFITGFCNNGCSVGYLGDMCNESKKFFKLSKLLKTQPFKQLSFKYSISPKCKHISFKACNVGYFGMHCTQSCSPNCLYGVCRHYDGACTCKPGWCGSPYWNISKLILTCTNHLLIVVMCKFEFERYMNSFQACTLLPTTKNNQNKRSTIL